MSTATGRNVASSADRAWRLAGWTLVPPAVAAVLAGAWATSVPGGYFDIGILVTLAWLVLGACWLTVLVVTLVRDSRAGRLRQRARGYWPLALMPALAALSLLAAGLDLSQRTRFQLDRPELESYAAEVRAGHVDVRRAGPVGRIGTLPVSTIRDHDDCVSFTVAGAGFINLTGYAHCTTTPSDRSGYSYTHLTGPWYIWSFID